MTVRKIDPNADTLPSPLHTHVIQVAVALDDVSDYMDAWVEWCDVERQYAQALDEDAATLGYTTLDRDLPSDMYALVRETRAMRTSLAAFRPTSHATISPDTFARWV